MRFKISIWMPLLVVFLSFTSCGEEDDEDLIGNWINCYQSDAKARSQAVSFTIGEYGYLATGYYGTNKELVKDCWRFDPSNNQWSRIDSLPDGFTGRIDAVGFSANGKGYVCTGYYNLSPTAELKDLWEFDPASDTWTRKADFPGTARYGAVAFSVNNKGYVLGGYDGTYYKDLYEYDPVTNVWTTKSSLPGNKRRYAMAFVINNIAYVFGGENNGTYLTDFFSYDASNDTWTTLRDIANTSDKSYDDDYKSIARKYGATFVINDLGYVATGDYGSIVSEVWEYNPSKDLWTEKTEFEGTPRTSAVGFTINGRGFIATGKSSSTYFDDVWEFKPFEDYVEDDHI